MIRLIKSSFYNESETKDKLLDFLKNTDHLSMGEECAKYEKAFAEKQDRKYAVFVSSGSSANLVLIQALINAETLQKGDKVGISNLTWSTNIMPIIQLGLKPVLIDCELNTINVSPATLKEKISDLKALFLTNVLGLTDNIQEIANMCQENNVLLLEDNCESLGSKAYGKLLGNFGFASTFSSFVGHHLSTIEGGVICTDDENLWHEILIARAHGWDRNLPEEKQKELRKENGIEDFHALYTFYKPGYNARPTEINGFLGNEQLKYWDEIVEKRVENYKKFEKALNSNDDFYPLKTEHMDMVSNFSMPVICKTKETFEKYIKKFQEQGVEIRPIIAGSMAKQPFMKEFETNHADFPNSEIIHQNGFYFGNNPEMTEEEIDTLCNLLQK